jgi:flavin reductase (DIM6/NTAB) family NADH-FMN oxidoreductase RutF
VKVTKKLELFIYPMPAVLVSCGIGEQANLITLACVSKLCAEPPLAGISVRPARYSHGLITKIGEFVINLPTVEQVRSVDHCGVVSGRSEDKWSACGLTRAPAQELRVPVVAECPVNVECRLRQTIQLGSHDLFVGEVVAVQVDQGVLDKRDRIDFGEARPFGFLDWQYLAIQDCVGRFGFSRRDDLD